jgi:hypothetical protein
MDVEAYDKPGGWVLERARHHERRVLALLALAVAVVFTVLILAFGHVLSFVSTAILLGVLLLLRSLAKDTIAEWARWHRGGVAEESAGRALDELRGDGWTVLHDVRDPRGGNIDHIVSGPNGVYLVETKAGGFATEEQLRKVKRQAARLKDEVGVWVSPVLCLHGRRGGTARKGVVTILQTSQLRTWIGSQKNPAADPDRFRRFVDGL